MASAYALAAMRKPRWYSAKRRFVGGMAPEEPEGVRVGSGDGQEGGGDERLLAATGGSGLAERGREPFGDVFQHSAVQVLLRLEDPIDDEPGDTGLSGDVLHRRAVEPGPHERGRRRSHDLRTTLGPRQTRRGGAEQILDRH